MLLGSSSLSSTMANSQVAKHDTLEIEKVPELRDELPFDPDEDLSNEEKKQIVSTVWSREWH
jgi:hypothetical protein